ncbi:glutathione S-transferase family protein [Erythrobacter sp. JK5]|uniref:glutathione S-transferase family protein n=1 Tax=Erythrobacter sp. JK5 TaxID=2829500 RepID=UPI001BA58ED8|nr:glutathione S-transferase family protein [Erythrobacter sp. JK5]QUL36941.1 glutathione S-transferase family protein [Erythrobacter sp. JK5]
MTESAPDFVIYGSPVSPFVRKCAALCLEKDVPFETEAVNVFDPPQWFVDISPMKRIPVLRDRSIAAEGVAGTVADSSAICALIEKKHPEPPLYPADPYAHGRALFIEEYADTVLAPVGGLGIFRPIFFAAQKGEEPDLATARETWAAKLPPVLDYLDGALGDNGFYAGDALSIADIAVACVLMQISLVAETPIDSWPRLAAHFERMKTRPSIAGPFAKADGFIRKALPERFNLT